VLLSLDPGAKVCGLALFEDGELASAWLAGTKGHWVQMALNAYQSVVDRVVPEVIQTVAIERPQVYRQRLQKGDPNDLVTLALMAGALVGHFIPQASIAEYKPREWKGQVPKPVMQRRIESRLSQEELGRVSWPAKSYRHNVWDAIGIGLHHVGRLKGGKNGRS
jgi:hypothetical protein